MAVLVSGHCAGFRSREGEVVWVPPVGETLRRAERLLVDSGVTSPHARLTDLSDRLKRLTERERAAGPDHEARASLYREARWLARKIALSHPRVQFESLLLTKKFTQQTYPDVCLNHMPWCSRPGGDICVVSPPRPGGTVRPLIDLPSPYYKECQRRHQQSGRIVWDQTQLRRWRDRVLAYFRWRIDWLFGSKAVPLTQIETIHDT